MRKRLHITSQPDDTSFKRHAPSRITWTPLSKSADTGRKVTGWGIPSTLVIRHVPLPRLLCCQLRIENLRDGTNGIEATSMEEQDAEVASQKTAVNKARTARNREECVFSYGEGAKVRLCIRQTEPG